MLETHARAVAERACDGHMVGWLVNRFDSICRSTGCRESLGLGSGLQNTKLAAVLLGACEAGCSPILNLEHPTPPLLCAPNS